MKVRILSGFILSAMLIGCGTAGDQQQEHQHGVASDQVDLNNGEKWVANPATKEGISKMEQLLREHKPEDASYNHLALKLEEQYKIIFDKCTMEGEAHKQLHNYLVPLGNQIEKLKGAQGEEAEAILAKVEKHLKGFPDYFK